MQFVISAHSMVKIHNGNYQLCNLVVLNFAHNFTSRNHIVTSVKYKSNINIVTLLAINIKFTVST